MIAGKQMADTDLAYWRKVFDDARWAGHQRDCITYRQEGDALKIRRYCVCRTPNILREDRIRHMEAIAPVRVESEMDNA